MHIELTCVRTHFLHSEMGVHCSNVQGSVLYGPERRPMRAHARRVRGDTHAPELAQPPEARSGRAGLVEPSSLHGLPRLHRPAPALLHRRGRVRRLRLRHDFEGDFGVN